MNFIPKNSKTFQLLAVFLMAGAFVVAAYAAQVNVEPGHTQQRQRVMTDDGCTPTPPPPTPGPTES